MRIKFTEGARQLGIPPLQVLVELAAMNQPSEECWPEFDDGFVETLRERRRIRAGLPPKVSTAISSSAPPTDAPLPVSIGAAAILDKLVRKGYGLKSVRIFTLLQKWVHDSTHDDVDELIGRGNLEWTDPGRTAVNLLANRLPDTERIVELYRRKQKEGLLNRGNEG